MKPSSSITNFQSTIKKQYSPTCCLIFSQT